MHEETLARLWEQESDRYLRARAEEVFVLTAERILYMAGEKNNIPTPKFIEMTEMFEGVANQLQVIIDYYKKEKEEGRGGIICSTENISPTL